MSRRFRELNYGIFDFQIEIAPADGTIGLLEAALCAALSHVTLPCFQPDVECMQWGQTRRNSERVLRSTARWSDAGAPSAASLSKPSGRE